MNAQEMREKAELYNKEVAEDADGFLESVVRRAIADAAAKGYQETTIGQSSCEVLRFYKENILLFRRKQIPAIQNVIDKLEKEGFKVSFSTPLRYTFMYIKW